MLFFLIFYTFLFFSSSYLLCYLFLRKTGVMSRDFYFATKLTVNVDADTYCARFAVGLGSSRCLTLSTGIINHSIVYLDYSLSG